MKEPKRILLIGGNGFVGQRLARSLAHNPEIDQVVIGALAGVTPKGIRALELDVLNISQIRDILQALRPTHVFHLAAIAAVPAAQRNREKVYAVNFMGTLNVAASICAIDPTCRLIFCSSGQVYRGNCDGKPLTESEPLGPTNAYGASKAAAELMIAEMASEGLRAVVFRPFNHTGAGQGDEYVVPSFASQIAQIERGECAPFIAVGNLEARRDFLDVEDVVKAYTRAILCFDKLPLGCVLNVASGKTVTIGDILQQLLSLSTTQISVKIDDERLRGGEALIKVGDASLARRLLTWSPEIDLSETLSSVLQFHRQSQIQN